MPRVCLIIFGASGSGKSTKLKSLPSHVTKLEGDDFHPLSNLDKMAKSIPLTDADRTPWLDKCAEAVLNCEENDVAALSCSALKLKYRDLLRKLLSPHVETLRFLFLSAPADELLERLTTREDHFFRADLLTSQLETLEVPTFNEKDVIYDDQSAIHELFSVKRR